MTRTPSSPAQIHLLFTAAFVLLATALSGCQAPGADPTISPVPSSTPRVGTPSPSPTQTPIKTRGVAAELATVTLTPQPRYTPTLTPTPKAPQFSLPTRPKARLTAWRPPAYPVPWAPNYHDHFYLSRPVNATDIDYPATTYGYGNVFFDNVVHTGIDIPGEIGTPIHAAGDGKIVWAGYGYYRGGSNVLDDPYGKVVAIKHTFGYHNQYIYTAYAHLDETTVKVGQYVQAGDQIGLMGETGRTTGPHLHFEVRLGEDDYFATYNPYLWLAPPQGWGILVGQVLNWNGRPLEKQRVVLHSNIIAEEQNTEKDRYWITQTYTNQAINPDPYYQENLVIGDLPAGTYQINIPMPDVGRVFHQVVEIRPGEVTYFSYQLWEGFTLNQPPTPAVKFTPAP